MVVTEYTLAETISDNNIIIRLSQIDQTALYQNIYGLETNFKALQANTRVEVSVSYFNTSFEDASKGYFTMYDSKCRLCINKETNIREVIKRF